MDFTEYKKLALRTESQPRLSRIQHALMGMSTEVAEMMDNLKKHMFYNKELDIDNIKEEMGDVMWYMAILSDAIDVPIEDVLEANIRKLKVRYPDGFTEYDAENRDTTKEMKEVTKEKNFDIYGEKEMTALEWLSYLPDGYRERALDIICYGKYEASWMEVAILFLPPWKNTKEGRDFRDKVHEHYKTKGETPLPPLPTE